MAAGNRQILKSDLNRISLSTPPGVPSLGMQIVLVLVRIEKHVAEVCSMSGAPTFYFASWRLTPCVYRADYLLVNSECMIRSFRNHNL
jgi:hypothetical protein